MESSFKLKMGVKLKTMILLSSAFLVGCIRKETPRILRPTELNGINGLSYYYYYDDTKELGRVIKKDYKSSYYDIQIMRDSLKLGDDFFAMVHVWQKEYKVIISLALRYKLNIFSWLSSCSLKYCN